MAKEQTTLEELREMIHDRNEQAPSNEYQELIQWIDRVFIPQDNQRRKTELFNIMRHCVNNNLSWENFEDLQNQYLISNFTQL